MNKKLYLTGIAILSLVTALAACAPTETGVPAVNEAVRAPTPIPAAMVETDMPAVEESAGTVDDDVVDILIVDEATGSTSADDSALATAVAGYVPADLTAEEAASLAFMREEEKLAHDVYITLYDLWGIPVFENIASSELSHTDAVKTLIDRYGLDVPAADNAAGVFTDPALQTLYDDLVATGQGSLESALRVGAAIEEIDILDLEKSIAQTDNEDIILVYENLMKGSRNHLRSFVSTLEGRVGETYVPEYLAQTSYDAIISTGIEQGGRGRGG